MKLWDTTFESAGISQMQASPVDQAQGLSSSYHW